MMIVIDLIRKMAAFGRAKHPLPRWVDGEFSVLL
jgi:hypothetical protein